MVDESCYKCVKYLMFFFNIVFLLAGCAILGIGIWLVVDPSVFKDYVSSDETFESLFTATYVIIAVGSIIVVLSFLGCCGAIKESPCMLGIFFFFILILFLALVVAGVLSLVSQDTIKNKVADALQSNVDAFNENPGEEGVASFLELVEANLNCCGNKRGRLDYKMEAPKTCKELNYATNCYDALSEWLSKNVVIVAGVAFGIAFVLLMGLVFSMVLCCAIRRSLDYK